MPDTYTCITDEWFCIQSIAVTVITNELISWRTIVSESLFHYLSFVNTCFCGHCSLQLCWNIVLFKHKENQQLVEVVVLQSVAFAVIADNSVSQITEGTADKWVVNIMSTEYSLLFGVMIQLHIVEDWTIEGVDVLAEQSAWVEYQKTITVWCKVQVKCTGACWDKRFRGRCMGSLS